MKELALSLVLILTYSITIGQTTLTESIVHDGIERTYITYIPDSYNGIEEFPLVLNFHGFGSNANGQMNYGDFRSIADTANFILVHPMGTEDFGGNTHWNVGWGASTVDDVGFVDALLDTLSQDYNINENRIYSTGMSNGGYMSYSLACFLSDRIAAIASVTGSMSFFQQDFCAPDFPTPILQIHGTNDATVPWEGIDYAIHMDTVLSLWVNYNNCNTTASFSSFPDINTSDGSTVDHFVYSDCDENGTVELMRVNDGAHTWPGTVFSFPGTNYDIDASVEVWKFFSQYNLNGLINSSQEFLSSPIEIYPNPSNGIFYFNELPQNAVVEVYNANSMIIDKTSSNSIDLSIYSDGLYFIKIQLNELVTIKKIIKG